MKRKAKMKSLPILLSIALSAIAVSSDITPVSATKMDGRCCQSSDGGRSYRYQRAMTLRAIPRTCTAYAASCVRMSQKQEDGGRACFAARTECMQTGVHVGPYSGVHFAGLERK
jgi:hypothetical protein